MHSHARLTDCSSHAGYKPILTSIMLLLPAVGWIPAALAQSTKPSLAPATATEEPRYSRTVPVPDDMVRRRPRQVIVLPSEPGEYGEDPMQLSSGVIGKLPAEPHRLPEGHEVSGVPVSIDQQSDWTVCYLPDETLLSLPPGEVQGWAAELDARRVPPGLVRIGQDKGVPVAPEAAVTVEDAQHRWRLVDPRRAIIVETDRQGMIVRAALPLRVLPNKRLMVLEAIVGGSGKTPVFAITGRIHEFAGNNYLLLEHLSEVVELGRSRPPAAGSAPAGSGGPPASRPSGREARPEDIIQQLLESKPRRAVVLPDSMPAAVTLDPAAGPVAEGDVSTGQQLWPEETMLVDRPGRLVPGDKYWTFSFEDKGSPIARKPIRLLPNRMLENAVAFGGDKALGVVLVVSGEVTEYRGTNYLLLRKVFVQRDIGNLR